MTKATIQIDHTALKAACRIMAKNDIRYYLNGVYVEATKDQTLVVATDGHRLILIRTQTDNEVEDAESLIIAGDVAKRIVDGSMRSIRQISMTRTEAGKWQIPLFKWGVELSFGTVEGLFPDWRKVVPKRTTGEPANFNPQYLADFQAAALDYFGGSRGRLGLIEVSQNGRGGALVTSSRADDDFIGVVMPFEAGASQQAEPPAWTLTPAPKAIAARYRPAPANTAGQTEARA
ncbi:DNA polymerase III subunit beta family protein [Achromobacter anxifer]